MKPESLRSQILSLIEQVEALEANIKKSNFIQEDNQEDALDEIESIVLSLDGLEEILDGEKELGILKNEL